MTEREQLSHDASAGAVACALLAVTQEPTLLLRSDSPRFTVDGCSDSYVAAFGIAKEELVGSGLFSVPRPPGYLANASSRNAVLSLLQHATATASVHEVGLPRPHGADGYEGLAPSSVLHVPAVTPGSSHVLHVVRAAARTSPGQHEADSSRRELESLNHAIAHDLRAPLRTISGFSAIVLEDYGEVLPAEARSYLVQVSQAASTMSGLIDAISQLSRHSRQPLRKHRVNLSQVAENYLRECGRKDPTRNVACTIDPELWILGDARLIAVALEHLLANAWKFTSRTNAATISFGLDRAAGDPNDESVYCVRDNGVGFDMQYASSLFGLFQKMHAANEFAGVGAGLATARCIIERHGGRIWAAAEPGNGATISFTLGTGGLASDELEKDTGSAGPRDGSV